MRRVLFNHLIRCGEKGRWYGETERLACLEVDYKFVLRRCLHRKIDWLFALEDSIDIAGGAPELVDEVGPGVIAPISASGHCGQVLWSFDVRFTPKAHFELDPSPIAS